MKFKSKIKECRLLVKVKLSSKEFLNEKELDMFSRKFFRGFLKPQTIKKNSIEYTGPIGIKLSQRLKKPISKYDFFFIMEQIVVATQNLENGNLFIHNIIWDKDCIYINELTKEVQFVYLPLLNSEKKNNVIDFMESIIYSMIPEPTEDSDYISKYTYFIKGLKEYSPDLIDGYISKEEKSVVNIIKKNNVGQSGFMTDKPQAYYEHYSDEATGLLNDEFEATGLLNNEEEETGLLTNDYTVSTQMVFPFIIRNSTGEKIKVNKNIFRIGKDSNCADYCISDNSAISRSHADIVTRENRYFIIDLNSKNRTYINGQLIGAQSEVEVYDGDRVKFANEEFLFEV